MIEVADKIAKLDAEHKNFIKDIIKGLGWIAIVGLGFAGAILGVNLKKKQLIKLLQILNFTIFMNSIFTFVIQTYYFLSSYSTY